MIVKAPEEKYPTAPEGTFPAVCVDEIDLGMVTTNFGGEENTRHMVRLVWQIDETDADAKRYLVRKDYTASLHEKAKLRGELKNWRGREFTFDELVGFDLEQVVGAPCMVSVVHATGRKGGTFANVGAVMKLPKSMPALKADGYVRVKDRKSTSEPVGLTSQPRRHTPPEEMPPTAFEATDDDVPF
jgi:hypothetical protein